MDLSTKKLLRLLSGLMHFDPPQDGEKTVQGRTTYKLTGRTRMAIAQNIVRLEPLVDAYQRARNQLIYDLSGGTNELPASQTAAFEKSHQELLDTMHEIDVVMILPSDVLQDDENAIPVNVLAALHPVFASADVA